jgi:hypothetical protein
MSRLKGLLDEYDLLVSKTGKVGKEAAVLAWKSSFKGGGDKSQKQIADEVGRHQTVIGVWCRVGKAIVEGDKREFKEIYAEIGKSGKGRPLNNEQITLAVAEPKVSKPAKPEPVRGTRNHPVVAAPFPGPKLAEIIKSIVDPDDGPTMGEQFKTAFGGDKEAWAEMRKEMDERDAKRDAKHKAIEEHPVTIAADFLRKGENNINQAVSFFTANPPAREPIPSVVTYYLDKIKESIAKMDALIALHTETDWDAALVEMGEQL